MTTRSWIRKRFAPTPRNLAGYRPRLEALEERLAPAGASTHTTLASQWFVNGPAGLELAGARLHALPGPGGQRWHRSLKLSISGWGQRACHRQCDRGCADLEPQRRFDGVDLQRARSVRRVGAESADPSRCRAATAATTC
jgi:hypothetical protein